MGRKGDLTRVKIVESATYCLLQFGDRKTTFQAIADHCGVSQALVVRYLKNRENIFPVVLDHWIQWARAKTMEALQEVDSPDEKLRRYLRVSVDLFLSHEFSRVYLLLHYFAGVDDRFRVINAEIKNVAHTRVSQMIEDGIAQGIFRKVDVPLIAKTIHNNLVGHVLSAITEPQQPFHLRLGQALEDTCLALVLQSSKA